LQLLHASDYHVGRSLAHLLISFFHPRIFGRTWANFRETLPHDVVTCSVLSFQPYSFTLLFNFVKVYTIVIVYKFKHVCAHIPNILWNTIKNILQKSPPLCRRQDTQHFFSFHPPNFDSSITHPSEFSSSDLFLDCKSFNSQVLWLDSSSSTQKATRKTIQLLTQLYTVSQKSSHLLTVRNFVKS